MPIPYQAALKLYAKQKGHFVLPKKGSADYEAVRKLMSDTEMSAEHQVKKRVSKKILEGEIVGSKAPTGKKGASYVTTTEGDPVLPPRAETTVIDPQAKRVRQKKEVVNAVKLPEKEEKGKIERDGKPASIDYVEHLENSNIGAGGSLAAEFPGQKERIEKELKKGRKAPKVVKVREGEDKTIKDMKTDDPKAIEGKAPFSMAALRLRLLC